MTTITTDEKISVSPNNYQETLKNNFDDVKVEMKNFIQNNPLAAVTITAGLSFLFARLIYKRKN